MLMALTEKMIMVFSFFTPDGKYIEWNGNYLYSDIPFVVESPILNIAGDE